MTEPAAAPTDDEVYAAMEVLCAALDNMKGDVFAIAGKGYFMAIARRQSAEHLEDYIIHQSSWLTDAPLVRDPTKLN